MAWDMKKFAVIGGLVFIVLTALTIYAFIFWLPSFYEIDEATGEAPAPALPEVIGRAGSMILIGVVLVVFLGAVAFVVWDLFFRKKELHIMKEHQKTIKEAAMLNPVETMGSLIMTGMGKIQHYNLGQIVGHTQVPVKFERNIMYDETGKEIFDMSETEKDFAKRKDLAEAEGRDTYDFFAFVQKKGFYALPLFSLMEPVKIFACYLNERSQDLIGDVEIYDVGTWKYGSVFVPAQRAREPMHTVYDIKNQLMPIAYMSLLDYIGLVAQRGVEGDTSLQKWLQTKATQVNIKE